MPNFRSIFITAFKKTPDFQSGDELNADMSSSFRGNPAFQSGEDVILSYFAYLAATVLLLFYNGGRLGS